MSRPPTSSKVTWEPGHVEPRLLSRHPRFEKFIVRSCHGATVATLERRSPGEPWRALTYLPHAEQVAKCMDRGEAERAVEKVLEREVYMAPGLAALVDRMAAAVMGRGARGEELWLN
jgi:hypothetical protein